MIRAFIFDWDDTLVQTRQCRFAAIRELARRFYHHSLDDSEIELHWGKPFQSFFNALFSGHDTDIDRVVERYLSLTSEFPLLAYPEAAEALTRLSRHYCLGILTSAHSSVVLPDLSRLDFPVGTFVAVQCAEETPYHKPDPRVFEPLLSRLAERGITKDETCYVGDHLNDFFAASGAGLRFVGICRSPCDQRRFEGAACEWVGGLHELWDIK